MDNKKRDAMIRSLQNAKTKLLHKMDSFICFALKGEEYEEDLCNWIQSQLAEHSNYARWLYANDIEVWRRSLFNNNAYPIFVEARCQWIDAMIEELRKG